MDITITLTDPQYADALVVFKDVRGGCQRLIDAEAVNWASIAASQAKTARLAKLEAAPKELRDAVDAIALPVDEKPVDEEVVG